MQKIQFEGIDAKQKCSKQNKMISNKRLHSATYLRLQLVILLCLLPSEVILTVCYVKMFPRIGENGSVTEHTTHQNLLYSDTFPSYLRKRNSHQVQDSVQCRYLGTVHGQRSTWLRNSSSHLAHRVHD